MLQSLRFWALGSEYQSILVARLESLWSVFAKVVVASTRVHINAFELNTILAVRAYLMFMADGMRVRLPSYACIDASKDGWWTYIPLLSLDRGYLSSHVAIEWR